MSYFDTINEIEYHIKNNKTFIIKGNVCTVYDFSYSRSPRSYNKKRYIG